MRTGWKFLCAAALSIAAGRAYAGAWTENPGAAQIIVTTDYYTAHSFWDNGGQKQSQPAYSAYILNPYGEYGLRDGLTVGANLSLLQHVYNAAPSQGGSADWGIGDSEFFLRQRLWQKNGLVISAEPMVKLPSPDSAHAEPRIGSSHPDAGMGLSAGYGFSAFGRDHFVDVDSQYRYRFGSPENQVRFAGTLGINSGGKWMVMPQIFATYRTATSAAEPFTQSPEDDYDLVRMQLSAVYKFTDTVSFQMGGFHDVSGKNTGAGNGVLFALWKRL